MADKATIVIDADTTAVVQKTKRATDQIKGMGEQSARAVGQVAQSAERATTSFGEKLIKTGALVAVLVRSIKAGADELERIKTATAAQGAETGDVRLRASLASIRLGVKPEAQEAFVNQISPVIPEARASFLESLAGKELGLGQRRIVDLQQAFASGAFSQEEVLKAAEEGTTLDVKQRLSQLSPAAQKELVIRRGIDEARARARDVAFTPGRIAEETQKASDIANPGMAAARAALSRADLTGLGESLSNLASQANAAQVYYPQMLDALNKMSADRKLNLSAAKDTQ